MAKVLDHKRPEEQPQTEKALSDKISTEDRRPASAAEQHFPQLGLSFHTPTPEIAPQLSVSADNLNRNFGLDNPPLTYSFNAGDLVAGDSIADALDLTLETAASSSSPAGTYAITAASINSVLGYQINFIDGLLTVSAQADANLPSNYEGERSIAGLPIDIEASFFAPYLPSSAADYYEQDWLYIPGLKFMIESDLAEEFSLMQGARFKERQ